MLSFSLANLLHGIHYVILVLAEGSSIEDINTHFGEYLSTIPGNNVPSADSVLRGLDELKIDNTKYVSDTDKSYNFNINEKLKLLNKLETGRYYNNQITPSKKFDAKKTYKKNTGYFP